MTGDQIEDTRKAATADRPELVAIAQRYAIKVRDDTETGDLRKTILRAIADADAGERVDHPAHYGGAGNVYEAIKVIRAWGLGFSLGNAAKYLSRAGKKPGASAVEDLRKAVWYIEEEIRAIETEAKP